MSQENNKTVTNGSGGTIPDNKVPSGGGCSIPMRVEFAGIRWNETIGRGRSFSQPDLRFPESTINQSDCLDGPEIPSPMAARRMSEQERSRQLDPLLAKEQRPDLYSVIPSPASLRQLNEDPAHRFLSQSWQMGRDWFDLDYHKTFADDPNKRDYFNLWTRPDASSQAFKELGMLSGMMAEVVKDEYATTLTAKTEKNYSATPLFNADKHRLFEKDSVNGGMRPRPVRAFGETEMSDRSMAMLDVFGSPKTFDILDRSHRTSMAKANAPTRVKLEGGEPGSGMEVLANHILENYKYQRNLLVHFLVKAGFALDYICEVSQLSVEVVDTIIAEGSVTIDTKF